MNAKPFLSIEEQIGGLIASRGTAPVSLSRLRSAFKADHGPPAGYEVVKSGLSARAMQAAPDVEANVKGLLRIYADKSRGAFPAALDDRAAFAGVAAADSKDGQLDKEGQELIGDVGGLTGLQKGTDYDPSVFRLDSLRIPPGAVMKHTARTPKTPSPSPGPAAGRLFPPRLSLRHLTKEQRRRVARTQQRLLLWSPRVRTSRSGGETVAGVG